MTATACYNNKKNPLILQKLSCLVLEQQLPGVMLTYIPSQPCGKWHSSISSLGSQGPDQHIGR